MERSIRYFCHGTTGLMWVSEIPKVLKQFEKVAATALETSGADHVIYASKEYENDVLHCINFYDPPVELDDTEFEKRVKAAPDYLIYALHKR